jgi:DHA2 family multidrug resistance protein
MSDHSSGRVDVVEYGMRRVLIIIGVLLAPLLETIDSSIVNVALPTIQGNLGATIDEGAWVVTGYIIANVIVIPLTPWLQNRFGRRQYFSVTIVGFTIASVLCGAAGSIEMLITLRIIQGLFGGGLIATAQSTLRDTFPPSLVGASQGLFAVVILIGPIIAPVLGGYIVDAASWQWIFYINVLPGVVSAFIIGTMLRNPTEPHGLPVDFAGIALLAMGLGSLQFVLDEGERRDWFSSESILAATATAVIGIAAFAYWELFRARDPIVDLRVLRYRAVWAGSFVAIGTAATIFGTILILPQYTQGILNFTASDSGQLLLYRALPILILTPAVAGFVGSGKLDARPTIACGFLLAGIGSLQLVGQTTSDSGFWNLVWPLFVAGLGGSMLFIPLLIVVQSSTSTEDGPQANAFITLAFQLGGSIAGAIAVTIVDRRTAAHLATLAGNADRSSAALRAFFETHSPAQLSQLVSAQAQTLAFADEAWLLGILALCLIPFAIVMPRQPHDMSGASMELG